MTAFTKLVMVLVLVLPVGAYITGTLMASQAEVPQERPAIIIDDVAKPSPETTPRPTSRPSDGPSDDDVKVINPTPEHLDDDNSGRGNGDDDNSGPGGGDHSGSDDD